MLFIMELLSLGFIKSLLAQLQKKHRIFCRLCMKVLILSNGQDFRNCIKLSIMSLMSFNEFNEFNAKPNAIINDTFTLGEPIPENRIVKKNLRSLL